MQCNETTNVILILHARSRSRSLGLNVNDARAEDGLIDGLTDGCVWMDRSDGDRARRGRLRESVVVVVANARLVHRERAEKRGGTPEPEANHHRERNESHRIAFERSFWIARER